MKTTVRIILLAIGLFLLAACQQAAEPEASMDLAGTNWMLSSLNGELPKEGTAVTLLFGADGSVSGSDGCNQFSTTYTQDGATLTINQPAATTMMACDEPIMTQAAAYMTALATTTSFTASNNQLSLSNGDQILATFVTSVQTAAVASQMVEPAGSVLAGTNWLLSALNGELPLAGTTMYLQFGTDGTVSGSDGCNLLNTTYTQDGSSLSFGQSGASTLMACPETIMAQATAFTAALTATNSFTMTESDLTLQSGDQVLATFAVNPTNLTDTAWEVVSYNNGREAVVGLILGTEI
ncbi:MAG: META domain-containing protein, partial [Candidatus Promineifilaceae bacterium]